MVTVQKLEMEGNIFPKNIEVKLQAYAYYTEFTICELKMLS